MKRLLELKELGLSIAIDDFGTGFSSLSRLKSFPIDLIKIDMEFVQGISTGSKKDKAIIKGTIQLAKNLGIEVLAEGVETHEQFMFLKEAECDEIQGYYFHKPLLQMKLNCCWINQQLFSQILLTNKPWVKVRIFIYYKISRNIYRTSWIIPRIPESFCLNNIAMDMCQFCIIPHTAWK